MRVLIAEDESISRRVLETLLSEWGHDVVSATDGNQAWQLMQSPNAPRMVILDWMMPGMDGVEVCRRVRELKTEVNPYIILLTGKETKKDLVAGLSAGADDYVTKPFDPEELRVRIRTGQRIVEMQIQMLAAKEKLHHQATHDALTGILNRAAGLEELRAELNRSARSGKPASTVLIDLDHFKCVNDTYGHPAGDAVLIEAAKRMLAKMRPYETLARYGGEEFLAVLSECDASRAEKMAERLRRAMEEEPVGVQGMKISVTASFGVADNADMANPSAEEIIKKADEALYCAKTEGRNRVKIAGDPWANLAQIEA